MQTELLKLKGERLAANVQDVVALVHDDHRIAKVDVLHASDGRI